MRVLGNGSAVVALVTLVATLARGQANGSGTSLIAPHGLDGWSAERTSATCVDNVSETLTVAPCAGWLRTEKTVFGDYAITFDARARVPGARALLGVIGMSGRNGRPEVVLAVPMLGPATEPKKSPVQIELLALSEAGRMHAMKPAGEWQSYAVTRNRQGIHILLNGTQILSSGPVRSSDGWIGFMAEAESFELRAVRLRYLAPSAIGGENGENEAGMLIDGAYRPGKGVSLPKVLREGKPSYTSAAMAAQIQGAVLIECVVDTKGAVTRATVTRSLDDRYGLDDEALKAARRWRFQAGTRDGVAVPVIITIELTFSLKK